METQKFYDLFISGSLLLLNSIITDLPDNDISVKKNAQLFYQALDEKQLDIMKVGDMIKKVFTVISKNILLFKFRDPKLFTIKEIKDNREVKVTILPGIDLEEAYKYFNDPSKSNLWKYLGVIYYASVKMIYSANNNVNNEIALMCNNIGENISENEIMEEVFEKLPNSKLFKKSDQFNPFVGVESELNGNFGVDELTSGPQTLSSGAAPGIDSMIQMLGIDKMLNFDQLTEQLKNIDPKDIDDATENIKKLLGGNVDEGTSDMISTMLHDITDELRKDDFTKNGSPVNSIFKIAENVAKNMMPKFDAQKIDMNKIWQSTQNLAKNYTDQNGQKVFDGDNNPLAMLTGIMEKQMNMIKNNPPTNHNQTHNEMMKEYQDVMKKMGNFDHMMKKNNSNAKESNNTKHKRRNK